MARKNYLEQLSYELQDILETAFSDQIEQEKGLMFLTTENLLEVRRLILTEGQQLDKDWYYSVVSLYENKVADEILRQLYIREKRREGKQINKKDLSIIVREEERILVELSQMEFPEIIKCCYKWLKQAYGKLNKIHLAIKVMQVKYPEKNVWYESDVEKYYKELFDSKVA